MEQLFGNFGSSATNAAAKEKTKTADKLFSIQKYDLAINFYVQTLNIHLRQSHNIKKYQKIAKTHYQIGLCHFNLQNYYESLQSLNQALEIYQNTTEKTESDQKIALIVSNIG